MKFDPETLATSPYRNLLRDLHASTSWGGAGSGHAEVVRAYASLTKSRTILDYGCGKGTLRGALAGLDVAEYDPGVREKDALPRQADLVVCTDVLEHVEPGCLKAVLSHVRWLTLRAAFFIVATGPSKVTLADGRNAHLTQEDGAWWMARVGRAGFRNVDRVSIRKGLWAWVRP